MCAHVNPVIINCGGWLAFALVLVVLGVRRLVLGWRVRSAACRECEHYGACRNHAVAGDPCESYEPRRTK